MAVNKDNDLTRPSVRLPGEKAFEGDVLLLTIAYHADNSRIGEWAEVTEPDDPTPWILGRRSPTFRRGVGAGSRPLEDPHVSRRALRFDYRDGRLTIAQEKESSRVRLDGLPRNGAIEIDRGRLERGLPIMLGHACVLVLRLARRPVATAPLRGEEGLLLGDSAVMERLRAQLRRAAVSELDVLLRGETGTGKELAARMIHAAGARAAGPMVSVNTAAIPAELAPAALFGSARGAFTGADRASPGYFQQAAGGTLFLDEIGDAPAAVQPQLLRVLQEREVQPVGGPIQPIDVRVVSATDADIVAHDSQFKQALRHRLGAIEIEMPPLRDHPEDIAALFCHFLRQHAVESGCSDPLPGEDDDPMQVAAWANVMYQCLKYRWPGNVRELANTAAQMVWDEQGLPRLPRGVSDALTASRPGRLEEGGLRRMQGIDEELFEHTMREYDCEPRLVAQALGVSRSSVYRRIESSACFHLARDITQADIDSALLRHGDDVEAAARALGVSRSGLRSRLRDGARQGQGQGA